LTRPEVEAKRGSLRVLSVGIGSYSNARIPKLFYPAADARDLSAALARQSAPNALYRDVTARTLTDSEATLPALREGLRWLAENVKEGETLVLTLSGHGFKEKEAFYFAPVGFNPDDMSATGLAWREVLQILEPARRKARSIWIIADCCRAAPGIAAEKRLSPRNLREGVDESGNLIVCTASTGDTPSFESEDLGHGIFTQAWLEALSGKGPATIYEETPRGRVLTLAGLQLLIDVGVRSHARRSGVRQKAEFPRLEGSIPLSDPLFLIPPAAP
jgi:uncharacterized caspase-like protein